MVGARPGILGGGGGGRELGLAGREAVGKQVGLRCDKLVKGPRLGGCGDVCGAMADTGCPAQVPFKGGDTHPQVLRALLPVPRGCPFP